MLENRIMVLYSGAFGGPVALAAGLAVDLISPSLRNDTPTLPL